jgi:hypothetical protein
MKASSNMKSIANPYRSVRRTLLPTTVAFVFVFIGSTTAASAAKATGRDPAETIHSTTVVGQSGVPAPPPPVSSLGQETEKETKLGGGRNSSELSPGLSKARRKADQKRRERDEKEGKKRPEPSKNDDADDEGGPGKSK